VIQAIKKALDDLDMIKEQKSKTFEEAVQKCQNFNAIEQLIAVHMGQAEKGTVFEKCKQEFKEIFNQLETFEKQISETKGVIQ
jgi:hypothetical protein